MASSSITNDTSSFEKEKKRIIQLLVKGNSSSFNSEFTSKNADTSTLIRNRGNEKYTRCNHNSIVHEDILISYCMSVATAPNDSEELALAYGNRSAILSHIGKYNESLEDINRALELKYPDHLKAKIFHRKAKCYAALKNSEYGNVCKEAKSWLEKSNMDEKAKKNFLHSLDDRKFVKSDPSIVTQVEFPEIPMQKELQSASKAVELKYTKKFGRHLVATRRIKPGEIIIVEKCFAKCLHFKSIYSHCSHCAVCTWNGIPCNHCCYAMYCSEKCKKDAWKEYHDIECLVSPKLWDINNSSITEYILSIRLAIIAVRSLGGFDKLTDEINIVENWKEERTKGFSDDGIFRSDNYRSILSLKYHLKETDELKLTDAANFAAKAVELIAKNTTFFENEIGIDSITLSENDKAVSFGALVSRHKQMLEICAHTVEEIATSTSSSTYFYGMNQYRFIGQGIYPICSLINHSCAPNVDKFNMPGTKMVVYAIEPIEEGEQIFESYGPLFMLLVKEERRKELEKFHFKCTCNACLYNWPLAQGVPSCAKYLDNHEKMYEEFVDVLKRCNAPCGKEVGSKITIDLKAIKGQCDLIEAIRKVTSLPTIEVYNAHHLLKKLYVAVFGTIVYTFSENC